MTTLNDELRGTRSPAEALFILAEAVERLIARVEALEADAGSKGNEWGNWGDTTGEPAPAWTPDPEVSRRIEGLRTQLSESDDIEDIKSLEAQIELAQDLLRPPTTEVKIEDGERVAVAYDSEGASELTFPKVSKLREEERAHYARDTLNLHDELGGEQYIDAYGKGGPLWLYYGNRDLVLQYPAAIKQTMIEDVEETSPSEAYEMAADLLKMDSESPGFD